VIEACNKFSKETEEKIIQKAEASLKQREQQFDRLMERLQKHVCTYLLASRVEKTGFLKKPYLVGFGVLSFFIKLVFSRPYLSDGCRPSLTDVLWLSFGS